MTRPILLPQKKRMVYVSYKAQKIIIRIVLIGVIAVVACGVLFGIILKPKGYTGEEWYAKQDEYLGQLETFASTLDDVMTLYITGSVSEEDLMNYFGKSASNRYSIRKRPGSSKESTAVL